MLFPSASSSLLARIHKVASLGQLLTPAAKDARAEALDHVQFGNFVRAVEIEIVVRAWSRWPCCRSKQQILSISHKRVSRRKCGWHKIRDLPAECRLLHESTTL